jgi:hypothetical protein
VIELNVGMQKIKTGSRLLILIMPLLIIVMASLNPFVLLDDKAAWFQHKPPSLS